MAIFRYKYLISYQEFACGRNSDSSMSTFRILGVDLSEYQSVLFQPVYVRTLWNISLCHITVRLIHIKTIRSFYCAIYPSADNARYGFRMTLQSEKLIPLAYILVLCMTLRCDFYEAPDPSIAEIQTRELYRSM